MSSYILNTPNAKITKKFVKKFGLEIPVSNKCVRGVFTISNYRKYQFREEVDIQFKGEIYVMWNRKKDWYDSSIMAKSERGYKVSLIKVNRFLRKNLIWSVQTHLKYFCVDIRHYSDIQKIKWL